MAMWQFGFFHCLVLKADTKILEEHAASIRVEVSGMKMQLCILTISTLTLNGNPRLSGSNIVSWYRISEVLTVISNVSSQIN